MKSPRSNTVLASVLLLALQAGCATMPVAKVVAGRGCPTVVAYHEGGLGTENESGLLIAIWPDGRVLRVRDRKLPWAGYVSGWLVEPDRQTVETFVRETPLWVTPSADVALDIPDDGLTLELKGRRWGWWETPGVTRTPGLQEAIGMLLGYKLRERTLIDGDLGEWSPCLGRGHS